MKNFLNGLIVAAFITFFAVMVYLVHMDNQISTQQSPPVTNHPRSYQDSSMYLYDQANIIKMLGIEKKSEILLQTTDSEALKEISNHAKSNNGL